MGDNPDQRGRPVGDVTESNLAVLRLDVLQQGEG
jgi:hypothetical protein